MRQEFTMLRVRGVYDGSKITLLDPVSLAPNTPVEVLIPESAEDMEHYFWQRLLEVGLITAVRPHPTEDSPFTPVPISGEPISQTIIEERR
jgi:hypothetical protein